MQIKLLPYSICLLIVWLLLTIHNGNFTLTLEHAIAMDSRSRASLARSLLDALYDALYDAQLLTAAAPTKLSNRSTISLITL